MRVVVIGASGNVGTSLVKALAADPAIEEIVGVARRRPEWRPDKTTWREADVVDADLAPIMAGADCAVHLAWAIQPSRDAAALRAINVAGSERVFAAAAEAGVGTLVYASSVGAYSRGPKAAAVDEGWPREGIRSSFYSRHKAEVERILDRFERDHSQVRVVRMRPALIFKGEAADEVRRLFAGPFLPGFLVRPGRLPLFPAIPGLRFQAVHSLDVAEAYRLAIVSREARGAFNLAAEPPLGHTELREALGAWPLPTPASLARMLAALTWRLRLQPTPPGWLDMALGVPILDTGRARRELGWNPRHSSIEALRELLEGIADRGGMATPPLDPAASGPLRSRELGTGIGARNP